MTDTADPLHPRARISPPRAIVALMLREMSTVYGRSPGGYLWAILQPVAFIVLLSIAFSLYLRSPSLGTSFPLFYATGVLPFLLFNDISSKVAQAVRFSRQLLAFGALSWVDLLIARALLNVITQLVVFLIVMVGISFFEPMPGMPEIAPIANGLAMAVVLALGVGAMNNFLFTILPLWQNIWAVITRPLLLLSGVFYTYEEMDANLQIFLFVNPLMHVTGEVRRGIYPTYGADYVSPAFVYAVGAGLLVGGLFLFQRFQDRLLDS